MIMILKGFSVDCVNSKPHLAWWDVSLPQFFCSVIVAVQGLFKTEQNSDLSSNFFWRMFSMIAWVGWLLINYLSTISAFSCCVFTDFGNMLLSDNRNFLFLESSFKE